jgi:hypothetical protein
MTRFKCNLLAIGAAASLVAVFVLIGRNDSAGIGPPPHAFDPAMTRYQAGLKEAARALTAYAETGDVNGLRAAFPTTDKPNLTPATNSKEQLK